MQQLTREGPSTEEVQIIGVELAITRADGKEVELDMFSCKHTIPRDRHYHGKRIRVTLHTSDGDITLTETTNRL